MKKVSKVDVVQVMILRRQSLQFVHEKRINIIKYSAGECEVVYVVIAQLTQSG